VAGLGEGEVSLVCKNHVIDDVDAHDLSGVHHSRREDQVVWARCRVTGGMIVEQRYGRGRCRGRLAEDFARVNDGHVERPDRHDLDANDVVFGVQHHQPELFHRAGAVLRQKIGGQVARSGESRALDTASEECASTQFNRRDDLCRTSRSDATDAAEVIEPKSRQAMHTAGGIDQAVGQLQCICVARTAADHQCEELVVPETVSAESGELLTWPIVWCDLFHRRYTRVFMFHRRSFFCACILSVLLASGCAAPPSKEMDQAQGAIDAARAAGADRYATTEYSAATDALKKANDAVLVRDYRLALNYALESREHAQNAARLGAETQAKVRADFERSMGQINALMATARARLSEARAARVATRLLTKPSADLEGAEAALQKSSEAVAAGDYLAANEALVGVREVLAATIGAIDAAASPRQPRRRT